MMQHKAMDGQAIGMDAGEKYEDRIRRIRCGYLQAALPAADDSPWFSLRVMTGRETAVEKVLKETGIESLVPMRKGRELRRRCKLIPAPLIPVMTGYVLVRIVPSIESFVGFLGVEHVIGILGGAATPRFIGHEEVKRFNMMANGGAYDWHKFTVIYRIGEKVTIGDGPFAGLVGRIVSCRNDGRGDAVVEIDMFGGTTPALMPLAILRKM